MKNCTGKRPRSPISTALAQSSLLGDGPRRHFPPPPPILAQGNAEKIISFSGMSFGAKRRVLASFRVRRVGHGPAYEGAHNLGEGYFPGAAFFLLDVTSDFQQAIQHFGTFSAPRRQLRVGLLMGLFKAV